jgi:hypothetical protein
MKRYFIGLPKNDPLRCPISLFGVMDYGRLETAHTRALAWLLNPGKEHGFKDSLLQALLSHLFASGAISSVQVERIRAEYANEDGRFDILVQGHSQRSGEKRDNWLLLIEAKIDADEGEDQLSRYETWIKDNCNEREVFRVFLTPEGRLPETASEPWISMSFVQLACIFRKVYNQLTGQPGHAFLRYYLAGVFTDICRWTLPVNDPDTCCDLYNFIDYLGTVNALEGLSDDNAG